MGQDQLPQSKRGHRMSTNDAGLANYSMQLTVWSDTACANSAQAAPAQPAAYAER